MACFESLLNTKLALFLVGKMGDNLEVSNFFFFFLTHLMQA